MQLTARRPTEKKTPTMLDKILRDCQTEWIKTKTKKNHPYRYFTLSTINSNNRPDARVVVLRHFDAKEYLFSIYTDARSEKVHSLKSNPHRSCCFTTIENSRKLE